MEDKMVIVDLQKGRYRNNANPGKFQVPSATERYKYPSGFRINLIWDRLYRNFFLRFSQGSSSDEQRQ